MFPDDVNLFFVIFVFFLKIICQPLLKLQLLRCDICGIILYYIKIRQRVRLVSSFLIRGYVATGC